MIYLSGAVRTELLGRPDTGLMLTANMGNRPDLSATPFACDTGCYSAAGDRGFDERRYLDWLGLLAPHRARCLFATAPDVVGDAVATWARSGPVLPLIRAAGYPAALVAQDGIQGLAIEWDAFDVLFIGGRDGWKLSHHVAALAAEAKARGKWLHMGRVNSLRRLLASQVLGCDSADGTYLAFGPDVNLPRLEGWLAAVAAQPAFGPGGSRA